jgi:hypothetical protein
LDGSAQSATSVPHLVPSSRSTDRCRITFGAVLFVFVAIAAWLVLGHHLPELARLGIPTMQPRFADARSIAGASVSLAQGLDPLVDNPGDHLGRPMNYPRSWLLLAHLGLGPQHTDWLAFTFAVVFGLGLLTLLPLAVTPAITASLAAALFSPVVWIGLERANNDLPMFGLVAVAAFLVTRHPRGAAGCVLSAGLLKLFPIFALWGVGLSGARRAPRIAAIMALLFAGWLWWTRADLPLIRAGTYHWNRIGYGIDQIATALAGRGLPAAPILSSSIAVLVATAAVGGWARARTALTGQVSPAALAAFHCGAAVYVGTFCLGSNFDYRLVFLLLTLPQLVGWAATVRGRWRWWFASQPLALLVLLWGMTWRSRLVPWCGEGPGLILDEACSWWLVIGLLVTSLLALPDRLVLPAWRGRRALDAPATVAPLPGLPAFAAAEAPHRRDTGA